MHFRVCTYNIHKCIGMDRRVSPARISDVLREINADVVCLHEVVSHADKDPESHQAEFLAKALGMQRHCIGENRKHLGAAYGNVTMTRFPLRAWRNLDITHQGREPRGVLHTDIDVADAVLHVFNVHLGTSYLERKQQGRLLVGEMILAQKELNGPRIMLGDFNEWTKGLATQLLNLHLKTAEIEPVLGKSKKTYPGFMPVIHLDHIYFDEGLKCTRFYAHRSKLAMVASDHLPLVAEFELN